MKDNLPIYNIVINEEQGLDFVSFVADPAIMEMGMAFSSKQTSFKFNKDKQVVIGPAMIADLPLYREIEGEGFYVVFTKEVIEQLVEKFNRDSVSKKINVDHETIVESAFIKSNWIKEDMKHDKSNMYGFKNIPVGSWFIEVKVDDPSFWENEIKEGGKFGFSVEGMFGIDYLEFNKKIKKEDMKIGDLTKKEIDLINKFRTETKETFEEKEKEEEVKAEDEKEKEEEVKAEDEKEKEEEVKAEDEKEDEKEVKAEDEEEVVEEVKEEVSSELDEEAVMALVQPKLDELISMIAEVKSLVEKSEVKEEVKEEFKQDSRSENIKLFRQKFSNY